ncbi:MAG: hypothetical protein NC452_20785 [Eubacterium sp.]|nr:hypothetical protein [Eubacterium sp.]
MIKIRNECVCCPPEMGCLGGTCPYVNVKRAVCDECGADAIYRIDGEDYCDTHVRKYLRDIFDSLLAEEQAECLGIDFETIGG